MNVSQALDDVKTFLESDPLVQAAVNLVVPASTRAVLADVLHGLEAEFTSTAQAAAEQARADAAASAAAVANVPDEAYPQ